mmetsp:Transcript_13447/g.38176  ORF Transcript_13447/g.38176 Transcript_13447/m.38176 type:complete len:282 (-) Transcript_13447:513-1358(-)
MHLTGFLVEEVACRALHVEVTWHQLQVRHNVRQLGLFCPPECHTHVAGVPVPQHPGLCVRVEVVHIAHRLYLLQRQHVVHELCKIVPGCQHSHWGALHSSKVSILDASAVKLGICEGSVFCGEGDSPATAVSRQLESKCLSIAAAQHTSWEVGHPKGVVALQSVLVIQPHLQLLLLRVPDIESEGFVPLRIEVPVHNGAPGVAHAKAKRHIGVTGAPKISGRQALSLLQVDVQSSGKLHVHVLPADVCRLRPVHCLLDVEVIAHWFVVRLKCCPRQRHRKL